MPVAGKEEVSSYLLLIYLTPIKHPEKSSIFPGTCFVPLSFGTYSFEGKVVSLRAKGEAISSLSSSLLRRSAPRKDIFVKGEDIKKRDWGHSPQIQF